MWKQRDSHGLTLGWKKKTLISVHTVFLSRPILYPITQIIETQRAPCLPQVAEHIMLLGVGVASRVRACVQRDNQGQIR